MDYYDYGYDYGYDSAAGVLGAFVIIYLVIIAVALAVVIIQTIAFWKIFKKAGMKGWESLIPYYNNWVLFKIAGLNWWWFLFLFAPIVLGVIGLGWIGSLATIFATFNCYYNLSKKFNKDTGFAILLTLFTPICAPILGFSKNYVYNANVVVSNNGVFGPTGNNNNSNNNNFNNVNNSYQNNNYQQQSYNNDVNNFNQPVQEQVNNNVQAQPFSFCGNCGTKLENGIKFCPNCGKQNM